ICHILFGGEQTKPKKHKVFKIDVQNLKGTYACELTVLDQHVICGRIPRASFSPIVEELESVGISITDWGEEHLDINLLIGADVYGKLLTGKIHPTKFGPVAVETRLGWTVMGKVSPSGPGSDSTLLVTSMIVNDSSITELWKLDTLGITDASDTKSREELEQAAMDYFQATTRKLSDGRYEVSLPWIAGHPELQSNEEVAVKRLLNMTNKLEASDRLASYQQVFDDWLAEGIIEEVPEEELTLPSHYLPHRAVFKDTSETTKVRPVFDASCKFRGGVSLNDCLEKGRNLLELIPKIITGFRMHRHGLISDIEKAFLQISVKKEDRDFLRFLWWKQETMKKYRHCRVVFGVSCSPFLLAATLKMHLENMPKDLEKDARRLLQCLYVDNCVTSIDSLSNLQEFVFGRIMSQGRFNLRGWVWNDPDDAKIEKNKRVSVLGLLWNVKTDVLQLDIRDFEGEEQMPVTKRQILSVAHRLFDPIGFSCPVSLYPKILLQEAWKIKIGWDKELPQDLVQKFVKWREDLPMLSKVQISRWFLKENVSRENWTLHVFTDASKLAYAAVVFLRAVGNEGVSIQLLQAKSRVAPVKSVTIPRLELLGHLLHSRWWEGPEWLQSAPELWPNSDVDVDEKVVAAERKKTIASHVLLEQKMPWYTEYFSKYHKILRLFAWIQRFVFNTLNKGNRRFGDLTVDELSSAELILMKTVQREAFGNSEVKLQGILKQLNAVQDENGIWRLHTKIYMRKDSSLFRSPILLPADHRLVELLIMSVHEELSHCGVQLLMNKVRQKFWITKSRKIIKRVISKCVKCRRFQVKPVEGIPAPLPEDWVRDAYVFEVTGIDLAGPLYLRDKPKSWVVLFTCAVYRAVHFELVSSLSTECFLQSFRRFVGRRGRPKTIYTDNGTNFVGSFNLMKRFDWEKIRSSSWRSSQVLQPISWKFNPPGAPWWGGWWERIVRILKEILRKILGKACLDYEEMVTVVCDCEAVINARPLTYVSEDVEDLVVLSPSLFIQEIHTVGVPDLDNLDSAAFNKRLQYRQKLRDEFRKRFRTEYLGMLQQGKPKGLHYQGIRVGDIVLVGNETFKRLDWLIAIIKEVYPGKQGVVRVVKVKTATGDLIRPIQRLYPLEVCAEDREDLFAPKHLDKKKTAVQESPT
ncbi:unnamed protein product, partial [Allacma fusca]